MRAVDLARASPSKEDCCGDNSPSALTAKPWRVRAPLDMGATCYLCWDGVLVEHGHLQSRVRFVNSQSLCDVRLARLRSKDPHRPSRTLEVFTSHSPQSLPAASYCDVAKHPSCRKKVRRYHGEGDLPQH